jgi:hypothetical protein
MMSERASESGETLPDEARQRRIAHWRTVTSTDRVAPDDSMLRQ